MKCFVYTWKGDKTVLNVDKMLFAIFDESEGEPSVEVVFENDTVAYVFGEQAKSFWRYITSSAVIAKEE